MAKKVSQEEFEERIINTFPQAKFEVIEYTKISGYCEIKCLNCGKILKYQKASKVLQQSPFCYCMGPVKILTNSTKNLCRCSQCGFIFKRTKAGNGKCPKCKNIKFNDYLR